MKITLDKNEFLSAVQTAERFTSGRLNTSAALQGVYINAKDDVIDIRATDLNVHCHIVITGKIDEPGGQIFESKRVLEFLQLLQNGNIDLEEKDGTLKISQGNTKGAFPTLPTEEYPLPPTLKGTKQNLKTDLFIKNMPRLLFSASSDDARPVLTGVNFVANESVLTLVATDGFRLSVTKEKTMKDFSSMIVPAAFLREVMKICKGKKTTDFIYSPEEKMVMFGTEEIKLYSRLIEGEFPPYERVVPEERKTVVRVGKDDLMRNTKLISIFARDFSNVVLYNFTKEGLILSPKKEANEDNTTKQEIQIEGPDIKVAFNYRYVIDLLNNISSEEVVIELLRPDAPVLFKSPKDDTFFHIIMPVRIQEE